MNAVSGVNKTNEEAKDVLAHNKFNLLWKEGNHVNNNDTQVTKLPVHVEY